MRIAVGTVLGIVIALGAGLALPNPGADPLDAMPGPEYTDGGLLLRPEGYREWVFLGATLGPTNNNGDPGPEPGYFHQIYTQPEAYRHYIEQGEFPERTIMVMENYVPAPKEGSVLKGYLQHEYLGLEVAVKDSSRFDRSWAYYDYTNYGKKVSDTALAQWFCFDCHRTNGGDDNVFVQFYPQLRDVKNIEPELAPNFVDRHRAH